MKDVDALNRFYESEIATHIKVVSTLRREKKILIPEVCNHTTFHTCDTPQYIGQDQDGAINILSPTILTNTIIKAAKLGGPARIM